MAITSLCVARDGRTHSQALVNEEGSRELREKPNARQTAWGQGVESLLRPTEWVLR